MQAHQLQGRLQVRQQESNQKSFIAKIICHRGSELVDWLCEVDLAKGRQDAVAYARHLVKGRVIRHVDNYLDFYDDAFIYTFVPANAVRP